jgi:predicted RNase H-like nuclease (RuvC/YqgF family)
VTKINGDLTTLQGYAGSNDKTGFQSFVQGQFKTDTRSSNLDAQNLIKTVHLTKDQRKTLKSEMSQLQITYKTCMFTAKQQFANAKVQGFQNQITQMQNRSKTLAGKGVNTTALNNQISSASAQVAALQAAINSANDSKSLQKAVNSFCLYNGCKNGTNFHFAANSAIAVKQAQLTKIQSRNGSSTYSTQITQAQSDLNAAQSILNTIGNGQYSGTQQSNVWNNIKAAADLINQLWHELNHK